MGADRKSSDRKTQDRKARARALAAFMASQPGGCAAASLRGAARRISAFYDDKLSPSGLTIAQFGALASIAGLRAPAMAALAEQMGLDPSTLSRNLKPLEAARLISLYPDPDNRRVRRAALTELGKEKLVEAGELWMAAQKHAAAKVPLDQIANVRRAVEELG